MLLIAYPNADVDTEFSFNYTLEPYLDEKIAELMPKKWRLAPWWEFRGPDGEILLIVFAGIFAFIGLLVFGSMYLYVGYSCGCLERDKAALIVDEHMYN